MTMTTQQIENMAYKLIAENVKDYPQLIGLRVGLNNSRRALGVYRGSSHRVEFSRLLMPLLSEQEVFNTITHELAHAIAGVAAGHGILWKTTHIKLGGNGERTAGSDNVMSAAASVSKYSIQCTVSGKIIGYRNRKSASLARALCNCHRAKIIVIDN